MCARDLSDIYTLMLWLQVYTVYHISQIPRIHGIDRRRVNLVGVALYFVIKTSRDLNLAAIL